MRRCAAPRIPVCAGMTAVVRAASRSRSRTTCTRRPRCWPRWSPARRAAGAAGAAALAERLREARYGVVVLDSAGLPAHGALIYELVERLVATLNIDTRAAMLPLAGARRRLDGEPGVRLAVRPAAALARRRARPRARTRASSTPSGCSPTARSMRCSGSRATAASPRRRRTTCRASCSAIRRRRRRRPRTAPRCSSRSRRPASARRACVPHRRRGADAARRDLRERCQARRRARAIERGVGGRAPGRSEPARALGGPADALVGRGAVMTLRIRGGRVIDPTTASMRRAT